MVEELPYGKQAQAQVDFGEYNMRNTCGNRVKVFFFILTLSRSRFKYVWFTNRYFTSLLAVEAHEKAFAFIRGVPLEIVYDQDKVFMVSENGGDIILTDTFRAYTREQSFSLYFCRKSDPESKGKVENVVRLHIPVTLLRNTQLIPMYSESNISNRKLLEDITDSNLFISIKRSS
jgi:transposase